MTRWWYPDTDEWKRWIHESEWNVLESWLDDYRNYNAKRNQFQMRAAGFLIIMMLAGLPMMIGGYIVHPILGFAIAIVNWTLLGYVIYLMWKNHELATDYDKGYPQNLAHPGRIYR
jgi:hypothetical protein